MSREAVIATALYVMGRVRRRAYGGSDIDNAIHYLNQLRNLLAGAGVDVGKIEQLIRGNSVMNYVNCAVEKRLEPSQECPGNSGVVIDFVGKNREVTVGPALTLDVIRTALRLGGVITRILLMRLIDTLTHWQVCTWITSN